VKGLRDSKGTPVELGPLIAEGGEGWVYNVLGRPDLVAKIYKTAPDARKEKKLAVMASAASESLLRIAAWPVDVAMANGRLVGIVMPRVTGCREIHSLYSPKQRPIDFPHANWQFLVWTARNVAAAVETVHASGHVIGDVNQRGFLVGKDSTVRLIDCDSFQITANGSVYRNVVGVPEFTPPELHGQPFDRVDRTANHDAFGLAVIVFQVLCMGRHPFAGVPKGIGDLTIERAIREHRFAYSQTAASRHVLPPPHTLPIAKLSFPIASLFERAFSPVGSSGQRPSASEWRAALTTLKEELTACTVDGSHKYHRSIPRCPWCEIEAGGGPVFFITTVIAARALGAADLDRIYAELSAINLNLPAYAPVPTISVKSRVPAPTHVVRTLMPVGVVQVTAGAITIAFASVGGPPMLWSILAGLAATAWPWLPTSAFRLEYQSRKKAQRTADDALSAAVKDWTTHATNVTQTVSSGRREADGLMAEYKAIPRKQQEERQTLERHKEATQRKVFLEQHFISGARIPGIGVGLANVLASFGFETAEDIGPQVRQVPGIGEQRYSTLMAWRAAVEQQFRFDPRKNIDPRELAAIDSRYAARRQQIEKQMVRVKTDVTRAWSKAQELSKARIALEPLAAAVAGSKADASRLSRMFKVSSTAMLALFFVGFFRSPIVTQLTATRVIASSPVTNQPAPSSGPIDTVHRNQVTRETCSTRELVCVFASPSLDGLKGRIQAGTMLPAVPRQSATGWFTIDLADGTKGYIRSIDVTKLRVPASGNVILP
jgi:DNA-binding helix-hairpin-helix protein with protein kinase domain